MRGTYVGGFNQRAFDPWDSGVGNEDVEPVVELLDNEIGGVFNVLLDGDIDFISLRCIASPTSVLERLDVESRRKEPWTPYFASMSFARSWAFGLLLYHSATFAPASAKAWATARPMPSAAPVTMAVRPLREKRGRTESPSRGVYFSTVDMVGTSQKRVIESGLWGSSKVEKRRVGRRADEEMRATDGGPWGLDIPRKQPRHECPGGRRSMLIAEVEDDANYIQYGGDVQRVWRYVGESGVKVPGQHHGGR